jgi:hypothetical protein
MFRSSTRADPAGRPSSRPAARWPKAGAIGIGLGVALLGTAIDNIGIGIAIARAVHELPLLRRTGSRWSTPCARARRKRRNQRRCGGAQLCGHDARTETSDEQCHRRAQDSRHATPAGTGTKPGRCSSTRSSTCSLRRAPCSRCSICIEEADVTFPRAASATSIAWRRVRLGLWIHDAGFAHLSGAETQTWNAVLHGMTCEAGAPVAPTPSRFDKL